MRFRADEHEDLAGGHGPTFAARCVLDHHGFERPAPDELPDLAVREDLDLGVAFDPIREVRRHVLAKTALPDNEGDLNSVICEQHRGLPGGVTPTDNDDWVVAAHLRFDEGRRVEHAGGLEFYQPGNV